MRLSFLLSALALSVTGCAGCEDSATGGGGSGANNNGGAGAGQGEGGDGAGFSTGATMECTPGDPCEGGICDATGSCCDYENACGTVCCAGTEVCSFLSCLTPGIDCLDDQDCADGEFCDFSLGDNGSSEGGGGSGGGGGGDPMCIGGVTAPKGKCMPAPPVCPNGEEPGDPPTCVTECKYYPPVGVFTPEVKYAWGNPLNTTDNVMMSPIVIQLDDDNCDEVIDEKDIPEIAFLTFDGPDYNNLTNTSSTLHAISIVDGAIVEKISVKITGPSADSPGRSIASGDLDGDGINEIVTCTIDGRLRAYNPDGSVKWLSPSVSCFMPSIADLDQDGSPEVIDVGHIVNGADGTTKATFSTAEFIVVSDVDGDGELDIVTPSKVYGADGILKVDSGLTGRHAAVGDLDNDGVPEIIAVNTANHTISVWHVTGPGTFEVLRQGLDINYGISPNPCAVGSAGATTGGGTPTIAHFNNDEFPDVGLAGGIGYVVFDGALLMDALVTPDNTRIWYTQTQDCSSAQTGSSVFDFDGDGIAEVVYADETTLHIYAGPTGVELFGTCNTNGTLWEFPLVADVDNAGHADIVVASNSYSSFNCGGVKTTGVRVLGDTEGKWVRTRRIWNQHAYHVTNVGESGAIPAVELPNYAQPGLNNFRQNVQPSGQFSAPDLVVSVTPICTGEYGLRARVLNIGEAAVEPGVIVGFYEGVPGSGTSLGSGTTQQTLYPLTYEDVILPLAAVPEQTVYAVADDGMPPHPWHECNTDNNTSEAVNASCAIPQ